MSTVSKNVGNFVALIIDGQVIATTWGNKNTSQLRQALESARAEGKTAVLGKICADGRVRFLRADNRWLADSDQSKPNCSGYAQAILEAKALIEAAR